MKNKLIRINSAALLSLLFSGCLMTPLPPPVIPSKVYSDNLKRQISVEPGAFKSDVERARTLSSNNGETAKARLHLVSGATHDDDAVTNIPQPQFGSSDRSAESQQGYVKVESSAPDRRDYNAPLALGDPGVSASLWRESGSSDLFRDFRAWQPMDLITIVISESSEGKKTADTEVKQKSTIGAAIDSLFGLENWIKDKNDGANVALDPTALINASTQNDFKGEGKTNRKDTLKGQISAVVVEVLPSGVLRIEGQKIIAVNNEEQTMIISGLARTRDINSNNEVDSSKIANMRIDYFGRGTLGEAQQGGWGARLLRTIWPF